jgi:hypothetical protein
MIKEQEQLSWWIHLDDPRRHSARGHGGRYLITLNRDCWTVAHRRGHAAASGGSSAWPPRSRRPGHWRSVTTTSSAERRKEKPHDEGGNNHVDD